MADVIELNRKNSNLTPEEVLAMVGREDLEEIVVVSKTKGDRTLMIWLSDMSDARCHWILSKGAHAILESS